MKKQVLKIYALFVGIVFLTGCARAVKIISPIDQSQQSPPVAFEVEVCGYNFICRARWSAYYAALHDIRPNGYCYVGLAGFSSA